MQSIQNRVQAATQQQGTTTAVGGNSAASLAQGVANMYAQPGVGTLTLTALPGTIAELIKDPSVEAIFEDEHIRDQALQMVPPWGVDRVDQRDVALNGLFESGSADGEGVDVYVVDTGINKEHSDFAGRLKGGFNAVADGNGEDDWNDCNGHGTHCAGSAAGTLYGLCKKCHVYGVRVLGQPGGNSKRCSKSGSWASVLKGLDWVVKQAAAGGKSEGRAVVASMSIGGGLNQAINAAVANMAANGVIPVIAAGNAARDACKESPGSAPEAITVGATDKTDKIWRWSASAGSNWGTCVDILAPGVAIESAWHGSPDANKLQTGTSMATPHVAGAAAVEVALWIKQNGQIPTTDQVRQVLLGKATEDEINLGLNAPGTPNKLLYTAFEAPMQDYFSATPNHAPFTAASRRLRGQE